MRACALTGVFGSIFVAGFLALPGCGDDDPPPKKDTDPNSAECADLVCDPVILPGTYPPIPACCAEGDVCGLDGSRFEEFGANFEDPCQARDQPGEADSECPASTPVPTDFGMLEFEGCCRPNGMCGYLVDDAFNLVTLGLGCVDAAPFLEAGAPPSCTPG